MPSNLGGRIHALRIRAGFAALACAFALLIVFVSLFPFRFRAPVAVWGTFVSSLRLDYDAGDGASNVLLYLPLGFFAALSLPVRAAWGRVALGTLLGGACSLSLELIQTFDGTRAASVWDLVFNTLGALLGAWAGVFIAVEPVFPAVMVLCWLGFRAMTPYVTPAIASEGRAVKAMHFSLAWLAVGLLLEALVAPRFRRWAPALVLVLALALQFRMGEAFPLAEACGGLLAVVLWSAFLWSAGWRARAVAVCIVLYILIDALRPFHFLSAPRHFGLVPFLSIIKSNRESLISTIFAKVFMYGTLLWALRRAGWARRRTVIFAALFILLSRWIQVYLPARTAEITDAVMTLLLAACLILMEEASGGRESHESVADAAHREQMAGPGGVRL